MRFSQRHFTKHHFDQSAFYNASSLKQELIGYPILANRHNYVNLLMKFIEHLYILHVWSSIISLMLLFLSHVIIFVSSDLFPSYISKFVFIFYKHSYVINMLLFLLVFWNHFWICFFNFLNSLSDVHIVHGLVLKPFRLFPCCLKC